MQFYLRVNMRAVLATTAFVCLVLILSSDRVQESSLRNGVVSHKFLRSSSPSATWGGATRLGYFFTKDSVIDDNTFRFAAVTDLDQLSRVADSSKPLFKSILLPGTLTHDPDTNKYSVTFESVRELFSQHNEAGRGMELSELTLYQNRLLSFDDRTGTVFELLSKNGGKDTYVVPRLVITEGDGETDKGMKWEWATVKNNELYMGSMGKEYTNPDGSVANTNNLWISIVNSRGEVRRQDWTNQFNFVREQLGAASPGYIINEAILWSDALKSWIFLPRRISPDTYDENTDEKKGSNKLAIVDENFTKATIVEIPFQHIDPLHGFSTFAFVPNTNDRHALAIRTVEEDCVGGDEALCKQRTYFVVFDVLTGDVLMEEVKYDMGVKFEGVEFVNIYTPDPQSRSTS